MTRLVGRDAELAALCRLVDGSIGGAQALVLLGEPGIGKSVLLQAATAYGRQAGRTVLTTTGVVAESQLPFAGLHALLARPVRSDIAALPDAQRNAVSTAFGLSSGRAPDPYLIALGALTLLETVAARNPVLVVVDDAHWLDEPSHDALAFVARRLGPQRIAFLAAARVGYPGPLVAAGLPAMTVNGLAAGDARELLSAHADDVDEAGRHRILDDAQGNPLALVELPVAWRDRTPDLHVGAVGAQPLTARLERAFAGRSTQLSPAARDLLLVLAVAPDVGDASVRSAAAVVSDWADTDAAVEEACGAGLLQRAECGGFQFRHPLVRSGILVHEPLARRQAAHAALAAVLDGDPRRRTWHRAMAVVGPHDDVAEDLAGCAAESRRRGAAGAAAVELQRAAQLTSDPALRGHRFLLAAQDAFGAGRPELVATLLDEAAAHELSELDLARMEWLREIFHDGVPGDAVRVHGLCRNSELAAAGGDLDLALDLLLGAALRCWWADTGSAARRRVVAVARAVAADPTQQGTTRAGTDPRWLAAIAVADPVTEGAVVLALLDGPAFRDIRDGDALRLVGMAAHAVGDTVRAVDLLEQAWTALRETGRLGLIPHVLGMHHHLLLELGELGRAELVGAEAARLATDTRQPVWTTGTLATTARELALRGEVDGAFALAQRAARQAGRNNDHLCCALLAAGVAHLADDDPATAYEVLGRTLEPVDPAYHWRESFACVSWWAEAAVGAGRAAEARSVLERLEGVAQATPAPILHVHLALARALLADDGAAGPLFAAARAADLNGWPSARARLALAEGLWLARTGQSARSRQVLHGAAALFDALGMTAWSKKASASVT